MRHRYSILFFPLHVIVDFLSLNIAFCGAYLLKFQTVESITESPYASFWLLFNVVWLIEVLLLKPYVFPRQLLKLDHLLKKMVMLTAIHIAVISIYWVAIRGYYYSREHLLITYTLFLSLGALIRISGLVVLREYRARGYNSRRYVIAGYGKLAGSIRSFYDAHPEMGFRFYGYFDQSASEHKGALTGTYTDLLTFIKKEGIDCVYCCLTYMNNDQLKAIVDHAEAGNYQVKLLVDFRSFLAKGASVEYHGFLPILNISSQLMNEMRISFLKRSFDLIFSSSILVFGAPVFVIIAVITKLTSKGPVIFVQKRCGRLGQSFNIYKFRSMYLPSEMSILGPQHSQGIDDPRITPWGRFIRRTRLDELPQFFNVFLGQMSIVGPRPLAEYDVETLLEEVPDDFQKILSVKPGITSIGQVKFGYAVSTDELICRLRYDLLYPKRRSFLLDMWIIAQTLRVMAQGRGK